MAPPKSKKAKVSESESESASDSASDSSSGKESTPQKDAKEKPSKINDSKSESSSTDAAKPKTKSQRVAGEAEPTWELGSKKFITIGDFRGKTYVNIREYYEKDGKVLPSKKGISLNIEQWQNVCNSIDEVNTVLKK